MSEDQRQDDVVLHTSDEVAAALSSSALIPPAAPATLAPGPTADLRAAMARFSSGDDHATRRDVVGVAIDRLNLEIIAGIAGDETESLLADRGRLNAVGDIAFIAPTRALASAIEPTADGETLDQIVDDVAAMVTVIGRGAPSSPGSDEAVIRLLARFGRATDGEDAAVAKLSLLYQNHDATAALIASILVAQSTGEARQSPLAKTVRVATEQVTIVERSIAPDQLVIVPIESPEHWFGSGPHQCPGRQLAELIAAAVVEAIAGSNYRVLAAEISYGPDGRATTIPIESTTEPEGNQS